MLAKRVDLQFTSNTLTVNEMQSTSYNEQSNDPFSYFYGGDIAVEGVYFEDTFSTSGTTINNLLMGLGTQTTLPVGATFNGILGLGPDYSQGKVLFNCTPSAEKTCDEGDTSCYQKAFNPCVDDSVIDALYKQKSISTKTFSLWLNDVGMIPRNPATLSRNKAPESLQDRVFSTTKHTASLLYSVK